MKILETPFISIKEIKPNFARYQWLPNTENLTEEEYHAQNDNILSFTKENNITMHLIDAREFNFLITPEIQEKVAIKFFAAMAELGQQRAAFLVPHDLFTQVSLEQAMEEDQTGSIKTQYFDDEVKAQEWLEK